MAVWDIAGSVRSERARKERVSGTDVVAFEELTKGLDWVECIAQASCAHLSGRAELWQRERREPEVVSSLRQRLEQLAASSPLSVCWCCASIAGLDSDALATARPASRFLLLSNLGPLELVRFHRPFSSRPLHRLSPTAQAGQYLLSLGEKGPTLDYARNLSTARASRDILVLRGGEARPLLLLEPPIGLKNPPR